jgi:hypothetical protein
MKTIIQGRQVEAKECPLEPLFPTCRAEVRQRRVNGERGSGLVRKEADLCPGMESDYVIGYQPGNP